jgi:ADP-heptose:LPS heptosyltransferase
MGDFLSALPAMEHLRAEYTEVWTSLPNVSLARFADRARSIVSTGLDRLGITDADDAIEELRSFDSIVSWYGTNRPEFRELTRALGLPFTFHTSLPDRRLNAADFFLAQTGGPPGAVPRIAIPDMPREDFAVLHPFSGSARKNWPLERFQELAERLQRRMPVFWCRGPEDELPGAVYIPDLYDLACWLGRARVFIGNDSGPTHLAAAAGTPVIALFGPSDPVVWAPRGRHVRVIARESLTDILASDVEQAIL